MATAFPSPPAPQPASLGARLLLSVFGLILAAAGAFFTYELWQAYQRAAVTYTWPETPCIITSSEVLEDRLSLSSPVAYLPVIHYSYIVDDASLVGEKIKRVPGQKFKEKAEAEELVKLYPAGQGAKCYVNPEDPHEAILKRDSKAALYAIWFPLLFVIGGLGMVINMWWPDGPPEPTAAADE